MSETSGYFDDLETRDPEAREADLMNQLPDQLAAAKDTAPYFAELFAGVETADVTSRDALVTLPVTRKSDLIERQAEDPPLGGLGGVALGDLAYLFQSPGPIYEPGGDAPDFWRFARAFWAGGFRPGDIVHNTFSYHLTPAGKMMESAVRAIGCPVFPGGVGNTELQLAAISHIRPTAYAGTPSFLKILLDRAEESGLDVSSINKAGVGGEALPPGLRRELNERGVFVLQSYGTADLGLIAYESEAMEGMILDERIIVEIVRPGSGDLVAEGEVGEVVVTLLNPIYPLVRFATGDLSAVMTGMSPCGRTNTRIKGWMGRADQTTKVKGMFVHPSQINQIVARHPEVIKARLVVSQENAQDVMTLNCEAAGGDEGLASAIAGTLQSVCKVRGRVDIVEPGSLANDGKVIDDVRTYE
ncbi:MAG: AMP-binding protein [Alphaproteobacteria bacterium]|nr:AMP-binding protein [Alphaproteobacteria bacterium]